MGKIIKAGVLGGIVFFVWTSISWMALPWHAATLKSFTDDAAVIGVIAENAEAGSGMYVAPKMDPEAHKDTEAGKRPFAFMVFKGEGYGDMNKAMGKALVLNILTALLAAWLLSKSNIGSYWHRAGFVAGLGLFAALAVDVPYSVWWGFSCSYTMAAVADQIIGWGLAGLVMAKVGPNNA